jgi:hypothetical protein
MYLEHPDFRPAQASDTRGRLEATGGEMSRHEDLINAASAKYADILAAALTDKTAAARAITVAERHAITSRSSDSGSAASRSSLAATFFDLPAGRQASLLDGQWSTIVSPAMIPVLRRLVDSSPTPFQSVPDLALRRLYDLAPDEARPLILREIRNPRTGATLKTLGRLPDAELPDLDETLAANFEASESDDLDAA